MPLRPLLPLFQLLFHLLPLFPPPPFLNDEIIGSIGAAGAPGAKLDDNCGRAGLEKIRERLK